MIARLKSVYWPALSVSLLFFAALAASLFFHGFRSLYLSIAQTLLVIWLIVVVWRAYHFGITIPRTKLMSAVTLFWGWLALSLLWSRVPTASVINFWWLGSLPLTFWLYTLSAEQDKVWRYASFFSLLLGLVLALIGVYQLLVLHQSPVSVFLNINSHAALLNLIALPVAAYFVIACRNRRAAAAVALGLTFFILVFAVAITKGRAAAATLVLGFAVFALMPAVRRMKKELLILGSLIVIAFLAANLQLQGQVAGRLETLANPITAGSSRLIIWQQAWELLKASPWWGIGLGVFGHAFPPFRHPADDSAGFYVHNDYLQIWIEGGLPALVLLLAIYAAVLVLFAKAQSKRDDHPNQKIEMAGLFAGLLAIAVHSAVDFNFYILTILMLAGLYLGRLQALALKAGTARYRTWRPADFFGVRAYRLLSFLLCLFPLIYFLAVSLGDYEYIRGLRQAEKGELEQADLSLSRAHRLLPSAENVMLSQADLYRQLLIDKSVGEQQQRQDVFKQADTLLKQAQMENRYDAQIFTVRAQLYEQNHEYIGGDWEQQVEYNYRQALQANPRLFMARVAYANFLLKKDNKSAAKEILEEGLHYWYFPAPALVPYYALTAKLRMESGEREQAQVLLLRIQDILNANPVAPSSANTHTADKRL